MFETLGRSVGFLKLRLVARNWWIVALRGCVALLFSWCAYSSPMLGRFGWMTLFGFFAIADGLIAMVVGARTRWGLSLAVGAVTLAAGLSSCFRQDVPWMSQSSLIAWWAIIRGILDIGASIQLRHDTSSELLTSLSGILSLLFGSVVIIYAGPGFEALRLLTPAYALAVGLLMVAFALRIRLLTLQHPNPEGWPAF